MRVMVALENRFYKTPNGVVYSNNMFDYNLWKTYLQVFDEVIVFARMGRIDDDMENKIPATGPGVSFFELPMYIGPRQYFLQRNRIRKLARKAVEQADVFVLRVPGTIGTVLWKQLKKKKIPYAVDVVGSSYDSAKTADVNPIIKGLLYLSEVLFRWQRRQCAGAYAATYVTEKYLQKKYPPGGWNTHFSALCNSDILSEQQMEKKIGHMLEPFENKRPFRFCHAGTMAAKYKGQDLLIEAVAHCNRKGYDVELVLMGDGKFRPLYEQKAVTLGVADRVKFMGNLPPGGAVRQQYDQSDLLVFPSFTEGLPNAIIEAMERALPCVASRVGGIPELLEEDVLVPVGDVEALTEKLLFLLRSPETLIAGARRNHIKAKEYAPSILNSRRIDFHKKLAEIPQLSRVGLG